VGFLFGMSNSQQSASGWQVTVPATSANLGCAFDCGGLALKLHLKARLIPGNETDLNLEYQVQDSERVPLDDSNLVVRSLKFVTEHFGAPAPCGRLQVESQIPVGVGLGSSAAAVVAGLLLGLRCCGQETDPQQLLRWAEEIEGHIDNAAPALLGGLVFALCNNTERVITLRTEFPTDIKLVIVTPSISVSTNKARKVLPNTYSRNDVLHTLQRTALLAATCFSGKFDLFPELFDDRLHQPYRQALVPGISRCLKYRHEGLLGIAISGSGSSVLAFTKSHEAEIARNLQGSFFSDGVASEALITSADNTGAVVTNVSKPGIALQAVEKL
jgi:homoserine kinase